MHSCAVSPDAPKTAMVASRDVEEALRCCWTGAKAEAEPRTAAADRRVLNFMMWNKEWMFFYAVIKAEMEDPKRKRFLCVPILWI